MIFLIVDLVMISIMGHVIKGFATVWIRALKPSIAQMTHRMLFQIKFIRESLHTNLTNELINPELKIIKILRDAFDERLIESYV